MCNKLVARHQSTDAYCRRYLVWRKAHTCDHIGQNHLWWQIPVPSIACVREGAEGVFCGDRNVPDVPVPQGSVTHSHKGLSCHTPTFINQWLWQHAMTPQCFLFLSTLYIRPPTTTQSEKGSGSINHSGNEGSQWRWSKVNLCPKTQRKGSSRLTTPLLLPAPECHILLLSTVFRCPFFLPCPLHPVSCQILPHIGFFVSVPALPPSF
jgi:hypothetical protein